jgi:mannose/fructose/N-acetylgalactosamine-specific phosphotransferase system component IIB
MSVLLFRVDERLIHGQVVVGWGGQLHPDGIVVVDDELAGSSWEQELYCLGLPPDVSAHFASVESARTQLADWRSSTDRWIILTRNVATMVRLAGGGGLRGAAVNIGGIHHAPGRKEVLPYVFLDEQDLDGLSSLRAEGAIVSAQDLPGSREVDVDQLIERARAT